MYLVAKTEQWKWDQVLWRGGFYARSLSWAAALAPGFPALCDFGGWNRDGHGARDADVWTDVEVPLKKQSQ